MATWKEVSKVLLVKEGSSFGSVVREVFGVEDVVVQELGRISWEENNLVCEDEV